MDRPQLSAGVGLRLPHLAEVAAGTAAAAWLELHPEKLLAKNPARELLLEARRQCPVSVHTVGISVGSADGIDHAHLARLRELVADLDPILVSGHLAWSTHGDAYLNDLLPLPYDDETLRIVASHVQRVQEALGRPYLIENPSSYVGFRASSMTEVEFLSALAARTGCRLLCDVSNIHLSGHNMGYDPRAYLDAFPAEAVDELHLGGFTPEPDDATPGASILIDTHGAAIDAAVWPLYAHALRRFGAVPTLIEWDNDIPPFATLLAEARRADAVAAAVLEETAGAAAR
jgi:uncharacterized protein (UPF0276 family)